MLVYDFQGEHKASSESELESVLALRNEQGLNEFSIYHESQSEPCVSIMVNGDLACVHYFPGHDHPGFQSLGLAPGLDPDGRTLFSIDGTERSFRPNRFVIPFALALAAAKEFARSDKLPRCIEWFEL